MVDDTILVIGSTGKIGCRVARRLAETGAAVKRASRSGPTRFDWTDPTGWPAALDGVSAAYLVDSQDDDIVAKLRDFGDRAVAAGVRRLVLLSARRQESADPDLDKKEQALKDSGAEWTMLRPCWFAQNFSETPAFVNQLRGGVLALPAGDGLQPFVDAEDIAAVAVAALTEDGHAGRTYDLTGPQPLSFAQAVDIIATVADRDLDYRAVDAEEYVRDHERYGVDEAGARGYARLLTEIAAGRTGELSHGVREALGREPGAFAGYATRAADAGAWQ